MRQRGPSRRERRSTTVLLNGTGAKKGSRREWAWRDNDGAVTVMVEVELSGSQKAR